MSEVRVHCLNHASLLVRVGNVRMLFDPWLEGTAFSGGWGLRYENPEGFALAAQATHLWISHWHSDHLHAPSLAKLAELNPEIVVLANVSANFSMEKRLAGFGFRDVRPLKERETLKLDGETSCCRYPTAGIDNMLHLQSGSWSLLNFNDCNLPIHAVRSFRRLIGPVDLLFTNYNHAGKLFDVIDDSVRKRQLVDMMNLTVDAIRPTWAVPFASGHYYRAEESFEQNSSMLDFSELEEIAEGDPRYVVMRVGDEAEFHARGVPLLRPLVPPLAPRALETLQHSSSVPWDELLAEASVRVHALQRQFLRLGRLVVPDLIVRLSDHERSVRLSIGADVTEADASEKPHIEAHSQALRIWLARRFGDDTFVAGAHFRVSQPDTSVIERWVLITLLEASHLDPQSVLRYLRASEGRRFLWNRREEILATVLGRRWQAGRIRI